MSVWSLARLLARTRAAELRHGAQRVAGWAVAVALGSAVLAVLGTLVFGVAGYRSPSTGFDVLALLFALWCGGRLTQATVTGAGGALAPELFAALPLPRRRLASSRLLVGLADPALLLCSVAFLALVILAARHSAAAAIVAAAGVVLLTVVLGIATAVVASSLAPTSRRGRDLGTLLSALAIALVASAGTLGPLLIADITRRHSELLEVIVRLLPSGWPSVAAQAAARGQTGLALLALGGLAGLAAALVAAWPAMLARRMDARAVPVHRIRPAVHRILPGGPLWAVVAKELRGWAREPLRMTFVIIAVLVGVWPSVLTALEGSDALLPFGGLMTAVIAVACATNLYGGDGSSLWCTVASPRAAAADVRGRQLAWLIVFAPYVTVASVVLTLVSGLSWAWPCVLAGLWAIVVGGSAIVVAGSLVGVLPLDEDGGPTPAWSIKVHAALVVALAPAVPAAALVIIGAATGSGALEWAAVPVSMVIGVALALGLGGWAARRLRDRQAEILATAGAVGA